MTSAAEVCGKGPSMSRFRLGTFLQTESTATAAGVRAALLWRRKSGLLEQPAGPSRDCFEFAQLSAPESFLAQSKSPAATVSGPGTPKAMGGCHIADRTFGA
jgi:hypothetical protein